MSQIHYLRNLSAIKKRIILFTIELNKLNEEEVVKRNENSADDIYLKILNEFRALKMTSIIRSQQTYSDLLPEKSQLATLFVLRIVKEKYFLRKINDEIVRAGGDLEFSPSVYATINDDEIHPLDGAERVLRENAAAHSMLIDCYTKLIRFLKDIDGCENLLWLLRSAVVMEHKYNQKEQIYWKYKNAA